jgi:hypothetical protein
MTMVLALFQLSLLGKIEASDAQTIVSKNINVDRFINDILPGWLWLFYLVLGLCRQKLQYKIFVGGIVLTVTNLFCFVPHKITGAAGHASLVRFEIVSQTISIPHIAPAFDSRREQSSLLAVAWS